MNSRKILIAIVNASLILMLSCKKSSTTPATSTSQTVEATVAKSALYTYALPAGSTAYAITTQSSHATSSILTNTSGNLVYNYTAGNTFTGIDTVIISEVDTSCMHGDSTHMPPPPLDSNGHGPCQHPHGPKPGGGQIIFHINVKDGTTAP